MATVRVAVFLLLGATLGVSCCKDGHRELVQGTGCFAYKECRDGKLSVKTCENDQIFDSNTQSCHHVFFTQCPDSSECNEGDTYQHPTSCRMFYGCTNGRLVVNFCGVGKIFDPETGSCKVGSFCEEEKLEIVYQTECQEGARESLDSCREHRTCKNGRWKVSSCPLGKVFDKDLLKCRRGPCDQRSKRDTHDCTLGEKRRVEGSCKEYTVCEQVGLRKYTCSPCTNFNDNTKQCTFVALHPCSKSNPPPVPTEPPTLPPTDPPTPAPTTPTPTQDPSTPTQEPSTPTEEPSTPTEEPSTPTQEPSTPTQEPSTPTQEPSTPTPAPTIPSAEPTPDPTGSTPKEPTDAPKINSNSQELLFTADETKSTCKVGTKLPVKESCRAYLECEGGELKKQFCIWPWKFDSVLLECSFYFGARCA